MDSGQPGDAGDASDATLDADGANAPDAGSAECNAFLTPIDAFPSTFGGSGTISHWQQPALDAETWRLAITGLVSDPFTLGLSELEADTAHQVTVLKTLQCVYLTWGTSIWTGVPVRALLDRAGIDRTRVRRVRFLGADGFLSNLRLDDLYPAQPEADAFEPLVAFHIGGGPLPAPLGFPARLLCDRIGYKNVKWLTSIEATDDDTAVGQYQDAGFRDDAIVPLMPWPYSPLPPPKSQSLPAGPLQLCGHALSGRGGVVAVEIAIDDGAFEPASLASLSALRAAEPMLEQTLQVREPERFPWPFRGVWVPWQYTWNATPGVHRLSLRATDRSGQVSEPAQADVAIG